MAKVGGYQRQPGARQGVSGARVVSPELKAAQRTIFLQAGQIETLTSLLELARADADQLRRLVGEQDSLPSIHRHSARQRLLSLAADYDGQQI